MIQRIYTFKTVGPLHTGSDVNAGTMRTLRRQKCVLANPIEYESKIGKEKVHNAILQILLGVWYAIDWDNIKGTRIMTIWDEFANKLLAAARSANKYQFLETLCRSWGIESITNKNVLNSMNLLNDFELLDTVRNESLYLILSLRALKDEAKEKKDETGQLTFDLEPVKPKEAIESVRRTEDYIPCISGNSIRGRLRRLAMDDFCKTIGVENLNKKTYHTLFTGGFLDQSTQFEDFDKLEEFVSNCPMIGVLGSAIGNMTIEGDMMVGWAYPICRERGTGDKSYWQYLDTVFQTRHDSSKTEKEIDLVGDEKEGAQQMKYEYEVFAPSTLFEHRIACTSNQPLIISAFWHLLTLFKNNPFICGQGAVGNGEIDLTNLDVPDGANQAYVEYIESKKAELKAHWEGKVI